MWATNVCVNTFLFKICQYWLCKVLPLYYSDYILTRSHLLIQLIVPLYVVLRRTMLNSSCSRSKRSLPYDLLSSAPGKNQNVSNLNNACLPEAFSTITFVWFARAYCCVIYLCICIRFPWPQFLPWSVSFPQLHPMTLNKWIAFVWSKADNVWERKYSEVHQWRHYQTKSALKNKHLTRSVCLPTGFTFR